MTMEESVLTYNMRGKYDLFMCEDLEEKDADELLAKIALEKQQEKLKKEKERKENAAKQKTQQSVKCNAKKEVSQTENKGSSKPQNAQSNAIDANKPPRFQRAQENKSGPIESGSARGSRGGSNRGGFVRQFDELEHAPLTDNNTDERSDRGRGRGRGGFSARGGRGGSTRGGRRDFDRHSGSDKTGVKPTEKREGGGAHNWGTVQDDIDSAVVTEEAETSVLAPTNEVGDEENIEDATANEEKELEKQMTLEEWKAKRSQEKSVLAVKLPQSQNMRKANEGKDPFANMVAYRKPKDAQDSDSEEDTNEDCLKKQTIPINIRFYDQARRGGDRRRGGERGGRGGERSARGVGRGGESQSNQAQRAANIQLDSENDFPALK